MIGRFSFLVLILCSQNLGAKSNTNDVTGVFDKIRKSLVIIETDSGCASGFITEQDGKKYLMTNYHVLSTTKNIEFHLIDGKQIYPESLELSETLDLARFALNDKDITFQTLTLSPELPSIGDAVSVYGNSDGKGAVTELYGKITGVGPDIIEVDATFVRGNSGSPIINSQGKVVGVATFVTRNIKDWVVRDTRFENVRRFGCRPLANKKWVLTSLSNVYKQTTLIENAWSYLSNVYGVTLCWFGGYEQSRQASKSFEQYSVLRNPDEIQATPWESNICFFYSSYKHYWDVVPKRRHGATQNAPNSFAVQSAKRTMLDNFKKLVKVADDEIQKTKWDTQIMKSEAEALKKAASQLNNTINMLCTEGSIFWKNCVLESTDGNF